MVKVSTNFKPVVNSFAKFLAINICFTITVVSVLARIIHAESSSVTDPQTESATNASNSNTSSQAINRDDVHENSPPTSPFICPRGFEVEIAADDTLVHDAFTLTTDCRGNPVVSGPGYIRTLIGRDERGKYQQAVDLKVNIVQGAQGLWCELERYYYVADGGLWLAIDSNNDYVADSPPQKLLTLPTGGEHDAHAIRRGPDGWWYLIVGNFATNITRLKNDPKSPIEFPRAGTLWRISPDFQTRSVWAHGLRNAYDFDFLADGSIVTYDSDEERELTLPWYRQTRVFILSAGSDAGWIDSAWSDSATRVTMPHVISQLGRGSPTGVKVYDHHLFPKKYHNAVFVEDWTFGRILAIYPQPKDAADKIQTPERFMGETFLQTSGTTGFAPTDITVAPDGSLLICSGGRGTTGTLYRVRYAPEQPTDRDKLSQPVISDDTQKCLTAPSPWESWSRAQWEPVWKNTPREKRLAAIQGNFQSPTATANDSLEPLKNDALSSPIWKSKMQRRAIQFEVALQNRNTFSKNDCVDLSELMRIALDSAQNADASSKQSPASFTAPSVRQTAWWGLGHSSVNLPQTPNRTIQELMSTLQKFDDVQIDTCFDSSRDSSIESNESDPTVGAEHLIGDTVTRAFYEYLGLHQLSPPSEQVWKTHRKFVAADSLARAAEKTANSKQVADNNLEGFPRSIEGQRTVRQIQLWAAYRASKNGVKSSITKTKELAYDLAASKRLYGPASQSLDADLMDQLARRSSQRAIPVTIPDFLEALTILQSALGDYRHSVPTQQPPPVVEVFDGYKTTFGLQIPEAIREGWAKWCMLVADAKIDSTNDLGNVNSPNLNAGPNTAAWNALVTPEAIRTLAMLTPKSSEAISFCLSRITKDSHPTADIHCLIALANCSGQRTTEQSISTADALAGITTKVSEIGLNTESRWNDRLNEIWKRLAIKDPKLQNSLVNRPSFGTKADLFWLRFCNEQAQTLGRNRYIQILLGMPPNDWEPSVTRFVWEDAKVANQLLMSYLRKSTSEQSVSPNTLILDLLAQSPIQSDYRYFLVALESPERDFRTVGWKGISKLQIENPIREMVALTTLWNYSKNANAGEVAPRAVALRLRELITMQGTSRPPASENWNDWEPFLKKTLGESYPKLIATVESPTSQWLDRIKTINSKLGNADRGLEIYRQSKCASCHGGGNANPSNALGPSLTGVTRRFSTQDLFQAIFEPSKDISDRYRAIKVLTDDGNVLVGMKIYESVDGVTLQLADGTVARVNQTNIDEKGFSEQSLMPAGLIEDRSAEDLADLYAYLKSL